MRLALDLPCVRASDVQLEFRDGTITLHAERKDRASTIDKIFYVDQSRVDPNAFKAFVIDGVLTITGYSKDAPQPKQIGISSGPARAPKQITVSDSTTAAATTNDKAETCRDCDGRKVRIPRFFSPGCVRWLLDKINRIFISN